MPTSPEQIVIVGANLAGASAADELRSEGFEGRVVLIGDEPHRPYERPPLSKDVLTKKAEPADAYLKPEDHYEEASIETRFGQKVTSLDPGKGSVKLDDGTKIGFDACLLATGGRPRRLDVPGSDLEGVHLLRTMDDAISLREALSSRPRLLVVGAGFIGAEVAASARAAGCEVTMLDVLDVPLARVLGDDIGAAYAKIHSDEGVDLRLGEGVERIEGDGRAGAVVGTSGRTYEADLVVVGIGIEPNVELAADAGIRCDNGIIVDEHCRTSAPNVFAAGDVARWPDPRSGRSIRTEHFQNASEQGVAAARAMLGPKEAYAPLPWFWSDQYDTNLQMLGHIDVSDDSLSRVVRGSFEDRDAIAFYLKQGRLVAATAMNRGRDISAARRIITRGIEVDAKALADEDVELKDLLRS